MEQKDLEQLIIKYQKAYYDGSELISDAEYDKLWDELEHNYPNSILLNKIGEDTVKGEKIKHWMTMGSQSKFNTEEGFKDWLRKESISFPILIQNKIDGNSISLQYSEGQLLHGVTRGNGEYGENADRAVFNMPSVPKSINELEDVAIRGEVVMNKNTFEKKYASEFKNPRNLTAGLIKNEDFDCYSDLRFIAYDTNKKFTTEIEKWNWLKSKGFDVVETKIANTTEELLNYRNSRNPRDREYAIDGLILRQNNIDPNDAKELRPKKIRAFKWEDDAAETILRRIEWSRTGATFTPVANFDAVELEGTTVTRASLANWSFIQNLNLKIGDTIEVRKHGQIIPHVECVISHTGTEDIIYPEICPVCGEPLVLRENGTRLYCDNPDCPTHFDAKLAKWIGVLDAEGFGPALRDFIVESGIEDISEVYNPKNIEKICNNFGSINARKAYNDLLNKSQNISLAQLIAGYNMGNVGLEFAQTIVDSGIDTFPKLWSVTEEMLLQIPGWKETRVEKFLNSFSEEKYDMKNLLDNAYVTLSVTTKKVQNNANLALTNKRFCVTGKLENFSRKSIEETIEKFGGIVDSGVKKGTDYLITNTPDSGSSKNVAAQKLGTKIITESDFMKMIGE